MESHLHSPSHASVARTPPRTHTQKHLALMQSVTINARIELREPAFVKWDSLVGTKKKKNTQYATQ